MDKIVVDELTIEECTKGDIVTIEKNRKIDDTVYVILNDKEYCTLEELCFYIYENKNKPKLYKSNSKMIFYKFATLEYDLLNQYERKINGDING